MIIEKVEKSSRRQIVLDVKEQLEFYVGLVDAELNYVNKINAILNEEYLNKTVWMECDCAIHTQNKLEVKEGLSVYIKRSQDEANRALMPFVDKIFEIAEPLRHDFQAGLELPDKDFKSNFPKVNPDFADKKLVSKDSAVMLTQQVNQFRQMILYCNRCLT